MRISNPITHLDEIFKGKIGDSVGVYSSQSLKLREYYRPIRFMAVEKFQQGSAILERAIHTLAEEGNDGVSCVTDQERFRIHMPRRALYGDHRAGRIVANVFAKMWNQRD